jgi:pimeloyl-ACP methyl ester carboxylesterase
MHAALRLARLTVAACALALATSATASATPPPDNAKWTQTYITEADGTKLHADILRPKSLPDSAKTPVILSIGPYFNHSGQTGVSGPVEDTPYDPATANGPSDRFYDFIKGSKLLDRGYTWVQVDLRGFGGSTGCLDWAGPGEQADVKAAVSWAAGQSWSTGKVGMYGKSYDAVTGLIGIVQQPTGLSAVVAQEPVYDLYRYLYMNRTRYLNSVATPNLYDAIAGTPGPLLGSGETNSGDILAYNVNSVTGTPAGGCAAENTLAQQEPNHDAAYWKPRNLIAGLKGKKTPLFLTQGLLENNTKPDGAADAFNAVAGPKRAWIGMWDHVRGNEVDPDQNNRLKEGRPGWFDETMQFYDRYLKGTKPVKKYPKIALETNDGKWRPETNWPPHDAFPATAQLKTGKYSDDGLNNGAGDGGTPPYGLGIWSFSPAFDHEVRLSGTPHLAVDTDAQAGANLYADVYDVGPDNKATLLSRGAYLLKGPGGASFDLYDQDWVFAPGHRIGVLLTGGQAEWWNQPPTGQQVNVKSASLTLPYLACQRTQTTAGAPSTRLESYKENAPIDVDAQTIADNTVSAFPIPAALAPCDKKGAPKSCVDHRKFSFRIHQPKNGRITRVTVFVNGKKRLVKKGKRVTRVTLRKLPKTGVFTVRIVARSNEKQETISVRRYRGCKKGKPHTHVNNQHHHGTKK